MQYMHGWQIVDQLIRLRLGFALHTERERKNPQWGGEVPVPGIANYFLGSKNGNGKEGTVVPICLPKDDMEKFQLELAGLTAEL